MDGMYVGMSVQKVELARPWLKRKCFWILAEVRADGSWAVGQNDTCSAPLIISRTRSYMDSSSSNLYKCRQCTKDSTTAARIGFQGTQPNVAYLRSTIVRIWLAVINIAEDLERHFIPQESPTGHAHEQQAACLLAMEGVDGQTIQVRPTRTQVTGIAVVVARHSQT